MTGRDDFPAWVNSALFDAERALHNGDAAPRRALWSRNEPVSDLGAMRNANGQQDARPALRRPGSELLRLHVVPVRGHGIRRGG